MSDFLVYWRPETANDSGTSLNHAASNQFRRVRPGDTLWVTTAPEGHLQLLGRLEVEKIVGQREAELRVGHRLWEADAHALAKPGTEMAIARIPIGDIASKLRFAAKADRLAVSNGKVNAQSLQAMRRLEPQSVRLLSSRLRPLINTLSQLKVGTVYSRKDLREQFGITDATINNGVFEPHGHDSIWLFITESKTSDRTQYIDLLDGDTLSFDGQTEGRTDPALINHEADGRKVLLFYRKRKDEFPGYGFRFEGAFAYVKHDGHRPTHFTFSRDAPRGVDEVVDAIERLAGRRTSQGIRVPPKVRIAIDAHAMKTAISHFEAEGYAVEDVHKRQPVDLIVRRGREIRRVEVKGTQTTGEEVLLTDGEVKYAREHKPEMLLFIVAEVVVFDEDGAVRVDGGRVSVREWNVDEGHLQPMVYKYRPA